MRFSLRHCLATFAALSFAITPAIAVEVTIVNCSGQGGAAILFEGNYDFGSDETSYGGHIIAWADGPGGTFGEGLDISTPGSGGWASCNEVTQTGEYQCWAYMSWVNNGMSYSTESDRHTATI